MIIYFNILKRKEALFRAPVQSPLSERQKKTRLRNQIPTKATRVSSNELQPIQYTNKKALTALSEPGISAVIFYTGV